MKITSNASEYLRVVDSALVRESDHRDSKKGENLLDPQLRAIENTPVDAVEHVRKAAEVHKRPAQGHGAQNEPVQLSALAQESMITQEEIHSKLTDKLAQMLEAEGIDLSDHKGIDYAPDAVSQRIVDFSISLYGVFRDKHPSLSESDVMKKFESTVRNAVDSGYNDAMKKLEGIGISEEVLSIGRATKESIDAKFDEYFSERTPAAASA